VQDPVALVRAAAIVALAGTLACSFEVSTTSAWEESTSDDDAEDTTGTTESDVDGTTAIADTTDAESSSSESSSSGGDDDPLAPATYPADRVHSPITASVANRLRALAATAPELADDVFLKTGASTDVNTNNLHCFAGPDVELGAHAGLGETLEFWLAGEAAGTTPFDRDSAATEVGRSASWAIAGDPAPLGVEIDAIAPRVALVHFGTNDMQLGTTPLSALPGFYGAMSELLDLLEARGIVPVVVGLTRRGDDPDADRFIATYNAVLRGLAQQRQVPWLDAHLAIDPLPGHGLGPDGLHLEAYELGACIFDRAGLEHGYNIRNLEQLVALDRMRRVIVDESDALDDVEPAFAPPLGLGTADDPIVLVTLPFADSRDTANDGDSVLDGYPGCGDRDESGPELVYAFAAPDDTPVRIIALDRIGVDGDVHVLGPTVDGASCIARDDTAVATTLGAGMHHVVVDTWAGDGRAHAGPFLLVMVPCDDGDPDCAA
jgi:hypothetical protein